MKEVNLYIHHTIKGPGKRDGTYCYILEYVTERGNATFTKVGELDGVTEKQAEIRVITDALERMKDTCILTVYTSNYHVSAAFERHWIEKWKENGWVNAKNKPVANKEEWQKMADLLGRQQFRFFMKRKHTYLEWMVKECERKEKENEKRNYLRGKNSS